jgi:hypothetical protein
MDHRLGNRVVVDIPIRWAQGGGLPLNGRLTDFSLSCAFIHCEWDARTSTLITVELPLAEAVRGSHCARVTAHVVRVAPEGIGVEWCEFAVSPVADWIRFLSEEPPPAVSATNDAIRPIRAA